MITILTEPEESGLIHIIVQAAGLDTAEVDVQAHSGLSYDPSIARCALQHVRDGLIVCMGAAAVGALFPERRADSMTALRRADQLEWSGIPVRATYSPNYLMKRGGVQAPEFEHVVRDLITFCRPPKPIDCTVEVFRPDTALEFLSRFANAPQLALDFEGSSLEPAVAGFQVGGVGLARPGYAAYLVLKSYDDLEYRLTPELADRIGRFLKAKDNQRALMVFNLKYEVPLTQAVFRQSLVNVTDVMQECRTLDITGGLKEISRSQLGVTGWTRDLDEWLDAIGDVLRFLRPTATGPRPEWKAFLTGGVRAVLAELAEKAAKVNKKTGEVAGYNTRTEKVRDCILRVIQLSTEYYGAAAEDRLDAYIRYKFERLEYEPNYTEVPLAIMAKYGPADCINTLALHDKITDELRAQSLTDAAGYYNRHMYLGANIELNGILWDDEVAAKVEAEHTAVMVDSMRQFLLSPAARAVLTVTDGDNTRPLADHDVLNIQASTDVTALKTYFNPDSTHHTIAPILSTILVQPLTRVLLMIAQVGSTYKTDPEHCRKIYPALGAMVGKILSIPKDQRSRAAILEFSRQFRIVKNADRLTAAEQTLFSEFAGYALPNAQAETIQGLMDAYTEYAGVDLDRRETWLPEVVPLFYYKLYKKVSKAVSSFINGVAGRDAVKIAVWNGDRGYYERVASYAERPAQPGEVYLYCPSYGVNMKKTKRWSSAYHGIPPMAESKRAFYSRHPGGFFLKCDFSQHELRIISAVCGDEAMKQAFLDGADMHRLTAADVFGIAPEDVSDNQRSIAKQCMFGIVYLKTPESFAADYLNNDVPQAERLFGVIFTKFPKLKSWRDGQVEQVHRLARQSPSDLVRMPIRTLWGDPIWHEFSRTDRMAMIEAERYAVNWQIQSTGSNLAGLAAAETDAYLRDHAYRTCVTGFTHDAEEFDTHPGELFVMMEQIPRISEQYLLDKFGLPVRIDVEMGRTPGSEVKFERLHGGASYINEAGHIAAEMSGPREYVDEMVELLRQRYAVELGEAQSKTVITSWNTVFSLRGCYSSRMGQSTDKVTVPITIQRP